jgi:hypothetical protein
MKNIIIGLTMAATTLAACNSGDNKNTEAKQNAENKDTAIATHPQATTDTGGTQTTISFRAKEIIAGYLQLKNALAKDNGKDAATAGNTMVTTLAKVDMKSLAEAQMKSYMDIVDDLKEHAEHIGANAGKIEHQREHFTMMSKDMADFIKTFGNGGQTLYKDFCPMANDGKGATWISEVKEIKNPYLGSKMPDCGSVKETIK